MNANINTKRETEKLIEIDGRQFIIKKYDPLLGNYIVAQLLMYTMPSGFTQISQDVPGGTQPNKPIMNKGEFIELQKDILSCCGEVLPAGTAQVINSNGTYGITGFDSQLALKLLIAAVAFNFRDFFDARSLGSLMEPKVEQ